MPNDLKWMQEALEWAKKAEALDEVPIGAVIVSKEGQLIAASHNLKESCFDPIGHAECRAIQEATQKIKNWRLVDCTLYVTLEPCPMCLAACQQARIARIVYGAKDPKGGAISLDYLIHEDERLNHRFMVDYLINPECEKTLSDFFRKKRKGKVT